MDRRGDGRGTQRRDGFQPARGPCHRRKEPAHGGARAAGALARRVGVHDPARGPVRRRVVPVEPAVRCTSAGAGDRVRLLVHQRITWARHVVARLSLAMRRWAAGWRSQDDSRRCRSSAAAALWVAGFDVYARQTPRSTEARGCFRPRAIGVSRALAAARDSTFWPLLRWPPSIAPGSTASTGRPDRRGGRARVGAPTVREDDPRGRRRILQRQWHDQCPISASSSRRWRSEGHPMSQTTDPSLIRPSRTFRS